MSKIRVVRSGGPLPCEFATWPVRSRAGRPSHVAIEMHAYGARGEIMDTVTDQLTAKEAFALAGALMDAATEALRSEISRAVGERVTA